MKYLMYLVILALLLCSPVSAIIKPCTNCTADLADYAYLPGRAGGQTLNGGSDGNDDLILDGTTSQTKTSSYIILQPNGGKVGIGTIVPNGQLSLSSENATLSNPAVVADYYASDLASYQLLFRKSRGNNSQPTVITANNPLGQIAMQGNDGTAFRTGFRMTAYSETAFSSTNRGTYVSFNTVSNGETSINERLRITANGSIGIGTTSPTSQLHTTGTVRFANYGAGTATFDAGGNITSVSDEKYKKNRVAYTGNYSKVKDVVPIQFNYNEASGLDTQNTYTGFSAQNLQAAGLGECVFTKNDVRYETSCDPEGENCVTNEIPLGTQTLSVDDRCLLAAMFNSMKEKDTEIKDLKDKVKKLEDKVK